MLRHQLHQLGHLFCPSLSDGFSVYYVSCCPSILMIILKGRGRDRGRGAVAEGTYLKKAAEDG